jgi:hypothetical protein
VQALLRVLPKDAVVFGQGDADLFPMAYFHMVENQRPDITLYQGAGLILGNRLFHPLRTDQEQANRAMRGLVEKQTVPVVFTLDVYLGNARIDHWLYTEVDKSSADSKRIRVELPEEGVRFFDEAIAKENPSNAWIGYFQSELKRRYGMVLGLSIGRGKPPADERIRRHLELLANDYYGALGIADGLLNHPDGFPAGTVAMYLDRARALLPPDAPKQHIAGYFVLRGVLRANTGDPRGGVADLETALKLWPSPQNPALDPLEQLYAKAEDPALLQGLKDRITQLKLRKR